MYSVPKSFAFSRYVLASGSPRRKDILLNKAGIKNLITQSSTFEEENKGFFDHYTVYDYIKHLAEGKVMQVAEMDKANVDAESHARTLYIGCDTVVLMDDKIFEKPTSRSDALAMLKGFVGKSHQVCSAVVLLVPSTFPDTKHQAKGEYFTHTFTETSSVDFGDVGDFVIEKYIDTGEPMDKAGGYGIQGLGAQLVKGIQGDYYNVMGFPLYKFCQELNKFIDELTTTPIL